ncbi:MAG: hypothetical protein WCM93_01675 [Bacteroidota bacterium]
MISCSPEYPLAKAYIKQAPKGSILLMRPGFVYKSNKLRIDLSDKMSEAEKDSVAFYRSSFVQYIYDSAFLDAYINNFVDGLLSGGFDVYAQEYIDSFMNAGAPAYIVNLAQLQMDESRDSTFEAIGESDEEGNNVYQDIKINTVHLNSWIEVTELNADSGKVKKLFYASSLARDGVSSRLSVLPTGELRLTYKIDSLNLNDLYDLAAKSGKIYGNYLYDYFMNEYIRKSLPPWVQPVRSLHYDLDLRRIRNSGGEGFQEIEEGR